MKGAPERILSRCNKLLLNGVEVELTKEKLDEIEYWMSQFAWMIDHFKGIVEYVVGRVRII